VSIWYDWHDDGTDPTNPEHHFGTVHFPYDPTSDPVYTPKPAYLAAATLTRLLSGNTYSGPLQLVRSIDHALAFSDGQSTRFVAWTALSVPLVETLPLPPGTYAVVSHVGDDLGTVTADANGAAVRLTDAPVYLLPQQASP
jgi:polysaccharide biosynthesis protein PslG